MKRFPPFLLAMLSTFGWGLSWAAELPQEVRALIERRQVCEHWRGEEGYDAERRVDIHRGICQSCAGADAEKERLLQKFQKQPEIMAALRAIEPVEPARDAGRMQRLCAATPQQGTGT